MKKKFNSMGSASKVILTCLILLGLPSLLLSQALTTEKKTDPDTILKTNVRGLRDYLQKKSDCFSSISNYNSQTLAYARQASRSYKKFGSSQYDQAAQS